MTPTDFETPGYTGNINSLGAPLNRSDASVRQAIAELERMEVPGDRLGAVQRQHPKIGLKVCRAVAGIPGGRCQDTLARLADTAEHSPGQPDVFSNG